MRATILRIICLLVAASTAPAVEPLYAVKQPVPREFSQLEAILERVPVMTHDRGNRLPMILWECGPFAPQPAATYRALLARGLTQHIQMTTNHLAIAKALQAAGSPVIMMQGAGGPWPSQLAGDPREWAHQFDAGYQPQGPVHACLLALKGWQLEADNIRATLRQFKAAGVTVDAVWMDWEGDPMEGGPEVYQQALHCQRCRATLPAGVLASEQAFDVYRRRLCFELLGAYLAAPVQEVFPKCETTNWMVVHSTPERPLLSWGDSPVAPRMPVLFTASNPVAYGITIFWKSWRKQWPLDREHVDQFYFHLLLRMVSADQFNARRWAPDRHCYPWVDRWCPDNDDPQIPIMTRERYREALRQMWLRGVDGMQIFQPRRPGYEEMAIAEVQDAVAVYDEMLAWREFLDAGEPFGFDVPAAQDDGVVWSGLRLGARAVVRTFKQGRGTASVRIEPWPGHTVRLEATPRGQTYLLQLAGGKITSQPQAR